MTKPYVVVEHGESDYRLHKDDGAETGEEWDHRPDVWEVYGSSADVPYGGWCFRRADDLDDYASPFSSEDGLSR